MKHWVWWIRGRAILAAAAVGAVAVDMGELRGRQRTEIRSQKSEVHTGFYRCGLRRSKLLIEQRRGPCPWFHRRQCRVALFNTETQRRGGTESRQATDCLAY